MTRDTLALPRRAPEPGLEPSGSARAAVPGLAAVAGATALAFAVAHVVPALNAATVAVVLGALAANLGLHPPVLRPGTHVATTRLLRIAVVLLGLQLALPDLVHLGLGGLAVVLGTVAVTFTGTQLLGRALGLPPARSLLVATGFSICGASAIAAMREVAGGEEEDTAVAIALVTLCGSLAIVVLPALAGPLGLEPAAFGAWVGASVHDVGQAVATASRVDGALTTAVVVKLSRVVLLAPLVAAVALTRRTRRGAAAGGRRPPILPLFVVGFLAAIALRSAELVPDSALAVAAGAQHVLMVAALAGLGTGIDRRTLRATGGRTLGLGLASWLLVAATAYAGVRLFLA
ncbi:YeiH family protein [Pengzhenrongella sicca]|uniref:YeiH family protein n=1 Tax=Pengzhenrongella sicca TaxID=2819238 RepID=UPI001D0C8966|nr:putative sulfate exporter family transporter [Pengzhenrongella sicca]